MNEITTAAELDALPSGTIVQVVDDPTAPNSFWLRGTGGLWWTFAAEHGYTGAEMTEDWTFTVLYRPDAPARTDPTEEQVRDVLELHRYLHGVSVFANDPGWHPCGCNEWSGYWIDFSTHAARAIFALLPQRVAPSEEE